jgi:hypothetical protein
MPRTSAFRQRDLEKALAAARKVGVKSAVVTVAGAEMRFEFSDRAAPTIPAGGDTPEAELARWRAENGY